MSQTRDFEPRRRVLCIEWLDPLYFAGHWVPQLVHAAGGEDVGAQPGAHSTQRSWSEAVRLKPDLLLVMLCGFGVDEPEEELADVRDPGTVKLLADTEKTWILEWEQLYLKTHSPHRRGRRDPDSRRPRGTGMEGLVRLPCYGRTL